MIICPCCSLTDVLLFILTLNWTPNPETELPSQTDQSFFSIKYRPVLDETSHSDISIVRYGNDVTSNEALTTSYFPSFSFSFSFPLFPFYSLSLCSVECLYRISLNYKYPSPASPKGRRLRPTFPHSFSSCARVRQPWRTPSLALRVLFVSLIRSISGERDAFDPDS